jgi:hypothetical protein
MPLTLHWCSAEFSVIRTASLALAGIRSMTRERTPWPTRFRFQTGGHWRLPLRNRRLWQSGSGSCSQETDSGPWRRGLWTWKLACLSGPAIPTAPPPPIRRLRNHQPALAPRADLVPSRGTAGIGRHCWSPPRSSRSSPWPASVGRPPVWTPVPTLRIR